MIRRTYKTKRTALRAISIVLLIVFLFNDISHSAESAYGYPPSYKLSAGSRFQPIVNVVEKDGLLVIEEGKSKAASSFEEEVGFAKLRVLIGEILEWYGSGIDENRMKGLLSEKIGHVNFRKFKWQDIYKQGKTFCLPYVPAKADNSKDPFFRFFLYSERPPELEGVTVLLIGKAGMTSEFKTLSSASHPGGTDHEISLPPDRDPMDKSEDPEGAYPVDEQDRGLFPLTSEKVRNLDPVVDEINDPELTEELAEYMAESMHAGGYYPLIGQRIIPDSIDLEKCTVFKKDNIRIVCFAVERIFEKGGNSFRPEATEYIFMILAGKEAVGHGFVSKMPGEKEIKFRFSIHGEEDSKKNGWKDFRHHHYGGESLLLIMSMCLDSRLFPGEVSRYSFWTTPGDFKSERRLKHMGSLEPFLEKAGFDESFYFYLSGEGGERGTKEKLHKKLRTKDHRIVYAVEVAAIAAAISLFLIPAASFIVLPGFFAGLPLFALPALAYSFSKQDKVTPIGGNEPDDTGILRTQDPGRTPGKNEIKEAGPSAL